MTTPLAEHKKAFLFLFVHKKKLLIGGCGAFMVAVLLVIAALLRFRDHADGLGWLFAVIIALAFGRSGGALLNHEPNPLSLPS